MEQQKWCLQNYIFLRFFFLNKRLKSQGDILISFLPFLLQGAQKIEVDALAYGAYGYELDLEDIKAGKIYQGDRQIDQKAGHIDQEAGPFDQKAGQIDQETGPFDQKAGQNDQKAEQKNGQVEEQDIVDNDDKVPETNGHDMKNIESSARHPVFIPKTWRNLGRFHKIRFFFFFEILCCFLLLFF